MAILFFPCFVNFGSCKFRFFMTKGVYAAIAVTGIIMLGVSAATGILGFMAWALALNGFMGQERAVNASMITFIVLAVISAFVVLTLSIAAVYFLAGRRSWNAAVSAVLSILVFGMTSGVLHMLCVVVSAVVANQLRTTK